MWGFQCVTLFGVKENKNYAPVTERTTLRGMFKALLKNDQLMVTAVAMALFMIGYCTTTAFGVYYFRYAFKDEGMYIVFAAVLAIAQLSALAVFPLFRKRFTRKQLYFGSMVAVVVSYLVFFLSFELLPLIIISGLGLFFAQAFIQLLMLLFLADAVEYGEWKLGKRNEAVSFAVQPFVNQIGGALSKGVVSITLIISGLNFIENSISSTEDKTLIESLISQTPDSAVWIMKISMMILPLLCILIGFILYQKKFKIDEKFYSEIISDLEKRSSEKEPENT
jgi:melibiose permease/lactose/raffinose/galactose permease